MITSVHLCRVIKVEDPKEIPRQPEGKSEISGLEIPPPRESRAKVGRSIQEFFFLGMTDFDAAANVLFLVEGPFAGIVFLFHRHGLFVFTVQRRVPVFLLIVKKGGTGGSDVSISVT